MKLMHHHHHHHLMPILGMHEAISSTFHSFMACTGTFALHTQDKRIKCLVNNSLRTSIINSLCCS